MTTWIEAITYPTSDAPFKVLPPAARQTNNKHQWIDPLQIGLDEPLEAYINRDPHPIPVMDDREHYYGDGRHLDWWLSGLSDLMAMKPNPPEWRPSDELMQLEARVFPDGFTLRDEANAIVAMAFRQQTPVGPPSLRPQEQDAGFCCDPQLTPPVDEAG